MSAARKARRSKMTKALFEKRQSRTRYRIATNGTAVRACRSSARASTSTPRSSTTRQAVDRWPPPRPTRRKARPPRRWNVDAAAAVGKKIAERALAKGVKQVVFDRGGYIYHGRIKALADAAREGGLEF